MLRFRVIDKRNVALSMEVSFFTSCPITRGLSVPLQTLRTSSPSLSSMAFVRVSFDFAQDHELVEWHLFEAAYRLVIVKPALAPQHRNLDLFRKYFLTLDPIPNFLHARYGPGAW